MSPIRFLLSLYQWTFVLKAWDGSGTFTRSNGTQTGATTWADADSAGNNITTSQHDTHDEDLADGIQACLTKNNESKPTADFSPNADNSLALGSTTLKWSDLFLGSGGVINWDSGDLTITHSANTLAFAGGTYTFAGAVTPAASDGSALGTSALMWSDLFLASGGVLNWNNGNYTATHSAGLLTMSGALTVSGAFTSLGIDDNATAEVLQIADTALTVGQSGSTFTISRSVNDQILQITSSGSATAGGNLKMWGNTHATQANDWALRTGGTNVIFWDDSATTLNFTAASQTLTATAMTWSGNPTHSGNHTFSGSITTNGQVAFPAAQNASTNANTLDDYEEGTWTPDPEGDGTAGTPAGTFAGHYIKCGQMVWFSCQLVFTDLSTMAGNLIVKGLPFTSVDAVAARAGISVGFRNNFTNDYPIGGFIVHNATQVDLRRADQDTVAVAIADLAATTNLYFSGTYRAAA